MQHVEIDYGKVKNILGVNRDNITTFCLCWFQAEVLPEVTFSRTGGSGQNEMTSKEDASPHGTAPSSEAALTVQSLEALVNAQELFQLREQVASLKLTGYLQARETRFFQVR